jgi:hypothetical protein
MAKGSNRHLKGKVALRYQQNQQKAALARKRLGLGVRQH